MAFELNNDTRITFIIKIVAEKGGVSFIPIMLGTNARVGVAAAVLVLLIAALRGVGHWRCSHKWLCLLPIMLWDEPVLVGVGVALGWFGVGVILYGNWEPPGLRCVRFFLRCGCGGGRHVCGAVHPRDTAVVFDIVWPERTQSILVSLGGGGAALVQLAGSNPGCPAGLGGGARMPCAFVSSLVVASPWRDRDFLRLLGHCRDFACP